MRVVLRISLILLLLIVVLGTLAVAGILSWVGEQETVRIIVDGEPWALTVPTGWGLVGVLAAVAATLLILLTVLPFVVLLALVIGLIGTVLGGLVALAPVLIVAGLIWWLVQRSRQPS
ncbi:MAG: hypothetical protein KGP02_05390 [Burkholderiales bacterium]|jgi:hypothetical protein|nr:hypothetical protein [Burkholderiales bacterium]